MERSRGDARARGGLIMFDGIVDRIRSKSRQEWREYFAAQVGRLREWMQSNGEKAAIMGFLLGVFIIVFYKLALVVGCLAIVGYQLVLIIAE